MAVLLNKSLPRVKKCVENFLSHKNIADTNSDVSMFIQTLTSTIVQGNDLMAARLQVCLIIEILNEIIFVIVLLIS